MKKIKLLLLVGLFLLNISLVKAESMPTLESVNASVTNNNGIDVDTITGLKHYRKGERLRVSTFGGKYYYDDGKLGQINKNDIEIVKTVYDMKKAKKVENTYVKVVSQSGLKMYDGPSSLYTDLNTTIPIGTELEALYTNAKDDSIYPFYYVEYNGVRGWIDVYPASFSFNVAYKSDNSIYTISDYIDIYKDLNNLTRESTKVDKDKEYKSSYYINLDKEKYYFIDELNGWVRKLEDYSDLENSFLVKNFNSIILISNSKGAFLYKSFNGDEKDKTVDDKTILEYTYVFTSGSSKRYFVNYKDTYGWIDGNDVKSTNSYSSKNRYIYTKDFTTTYSDINLTKAVGSISRNQEVDGYELNENNMKLLYTTSGVWVKLTDDFKKQDNNKYTSLGNYFIYKDNNLNSKKLSGIKSGEEYTEIYMYEADNQNNKQDDCVLNNWMYIEYNGVRGWIKFKKCGNDFYPMEEISGADIDNIAHQDDALNFKDNEDGLNNTNKGNNIIYIIGSIMLAILVIVAIIVFIKKREKTKKQKFIVTDLQ